MTRSHIADGRKRSALTREEAIKTLREYADLYGPAFPQAAFNPSNAKWSDRTDLQDRYYAGRPDGRPWPSLNSLKRPFGGSWSAARAAAGLPANRSGPNRSGRSPVRDVRIERVEVKRTVDDRLQGRLDAALRRAIRAENKLARLVEKPPPVEVRKQTVTRTRTVTKKVKVRDEKALERLRARLAEAQAVSRACEDQANAAVRDRDIAKKRVVERSLELTTALEEVQALTEERDRLMDRLSALETSLARLRVERDELVAANAQAAEQAATADLVRRAELRADAAELRAARAERQMAAQAAVITGEQRKLTREEIAKIRARGADRKAGPGVLGEALKQLARARSANSKDRLREALIEVRSATQNYLDTLDR